MSPSDIIIVPSWDPSMGLDAFAMLRIDADGFKQMSINQSHFQWCLKKLWLRIVKNPSAHHWKNRRGKP